MVFLSVWQIKKQEARMQAPKNFSKVGYSLAVYCQTGPTIFPTSYVGNVWLPKPVRDLHPSRALITESNAHIELGGGFHHYGYFLERQLPPSQSSNQWALMFYSEGADPKVVSTFCTHVSEKIPISNFVANTLAEFDRLSKSKQEDFDPLSVEKNRIAFLIQFDRTKIRNACVMTIQDFPQHWWPRLTLALIDSAHGREDLATHDFAAWVDSYPGYSRYLYLAYYYQKMDKPVRSAEAIEKAIRYPIVDMDDDVGNSEYRGYSAGVYAFSNGQYATVIKLCDALLPLKVNGDYAKPALSNLRQAAALAQSGKQPSFHPDENIHLFNPYAQMSLDALR
jgi:tetratricopeptide (TPR) repeat protein